MAAEFPRIIDTHAHVASKEYDGDRDQVIDRARSAGVAFIEIGTGILSGRAAVSLAERGAIAAAVGIHPHDAVEHDTQWGLREAWEQIAEMAKAGGSKVVAVGEIGLDYYRDISPRPLQRRSFEMGLGVAELLGLPAVIHDRDASTDIMAILEAAAMRVPLVFHCFGGDQAHAEKCVEMGGYLGIGGTVTYRANGHLREALKHVPVDRILLETDSPYLPPQTKRGRRNEPAYVLEVLAKVAEVLGLTEEYLASVTTANAQKVFSLPLPAPGA